MWAKKKISQQNPIWDQRIFFFGIWFFEVETWEMCVCVCVCFSVLVFALNTPSWTELKIENTENEMNLSSLQKVSFFLVSGSFLIRDLNLVEILALTSLCCIDSFFSFCSTYTLLDRFRERKKNLSRRWISDSRMNPMRMEWNGMKWAFEFFSSLVLWCIVILGPVLDQQSS